MSKRRHDALVKRAIKAIDAVHSDTGVSTIETMLNLKDIREHANTLIDAVSSDLKMQEPDYD